MVSYFYFFLPNIIFEHLPNISFMVEAISMNTFSGLEQQIKKAIKSIGKIRFIMSKNF